MGKFAPLTTIQPILNKFAFHHLPNNVSMKRNLIRFFRVSLVASLAISLGTSPASACWLLKRLSCRFTANSRNSSSVFSEAGRCSTSTIIVKDVSSIERTCIPHQIGRVDSIWEISGVPHELSLDSNSEAYSESSGTHLPVQPPSSMNPSEQVPSDVAGAVPQVLPSATDLEVLVPKESAEPNTTDHPKPSIVGAPDDTEPPVTKDQVDYTEKTEVGSAEKLSRPVDQGQPATEKDLTEPSSVMPITDPSVVLPDSTVDSAAVPAKDPEISNKGSEVSPRNSDPLDDLFGDDQSKPANGAEAEPTMPANGLNAEPRSDQSDEVLKPKSLQEDLFGDEKLTNPSSDLVSPGSDGTAIAAPEPVTGDTPAASDKGGVPIEIKSNEREGAEASLETSESAETSALPAASETNAQKVNESPSPAGDSSSGNLLESQDGEAKAPEKTQGDSVPSPDDLPAKPATDAVKALDDLFGDRTETLDKQAALVSAVGKSEEIEISIEQSQQRFWQDNTGNFSTSGKLILVSEDSVRLMKDTGKTCTVEIDRLSEVDRQYVNAILHGVELYESK